MFINFFEDINDDRDKNFIINSALDLKKIKYTDEHNR